MKIYHNPRCSKSRQALQLIQDAGVAIEIIDYLKNPFNEDELREIYKKLNLPINYLIRTGEEIYKSKYKGKTLSDDEWIRALVQHPKMLERPIVTENDSAILGRPPENVKKLL